MALPEDHEDPAAPPFFDSHLATVDKGLAGMTRRHMVFGKGMANLGGTFIGLAVADVNGGRSQAVGTIESTAN